MSCLFLVALWSPAGKGLTSWLLCLLCFVTFPNVSWSTSELRVRLAPWNWFKPSSTIFTDRSKAVLLLWIFYVFFCLVFAMPLWASVYMCLVLTCWERTDMLALVCGVQLWVRHYPIGILGQVWYLIVSIPDLCTLIYFGRTDKKFSFSVIIKIPL